MPLHKFLCRSAFLVFLTLPLGAQRPNPMTPDPNMPRPIDAVDSVFLEELTWLEVRDAMRSGKTTAIIATGGIEQNGPYLALGKHNYILRATTEAIARKLGNALVAPIVPFVPEGDIDPPSGHMRYPGTISVGEDTFKRLLTDIAASLKAHGFRHIILLADSGGNQTGMKEVAAELTSKWKNSTTIHYIAEYYGLPRADQVARDPGNSANRRRNSRRLRNLLDPDGGRPLHGPDAPAHGQRKVLHQWSESRAVAEDHRPR